MAITTAALDALVTAVTAEATLADKTAVLLPGLVDVVLGEATKRGPIPMRQMATVGEIRAELVDNAADFVTALTVA